MVSHFWSESMAAMLMAVTVCSLWIGSGVAMTPSCTVNVPKVTCDHIDRCGLFELVQALKNASGFGSDLSLRLEHSVLDDFPASLFDGYRITELDIHFSILEEFPHASFAGLPANLRRLDLSQNTVHKLNYDLMASLPFKNSLTHLSLYQNALKTVQPFGFVSFPVLTFLDLSRNLISTLPDYTFIGLVHLSELQLAGNQISTVSVTAFPTMNALVTLNLGDNWITTLSNATFNDKNMPAIANVWLPYNIFTCDCQLQWLKDWLTAHDILEDSRGTCELPRFATFSDVTFCTTSLHKNVLYSSTSTDLNQHHNSVLKIKEHVPLDN